MRSLAFARDKNGVALIMVLVAAVVAGSLALVALRAAAIRSHLVADARWHMEGMLIVESALAEARIAHRADLDTLSDGAALILPTITRRDGWSWSASATRNGAAIRLVAQATRRAADGTLFAVHRASLMLARDAADTVRVLGSRPRF